MINDFWDVNALNLVKGMVGWRTASMRKAKEKLPKVRHVCYQLTLTFIENVYFSYSMFSSVNTNGIEGWRLTYIR